MGKLSGLETKAPSAAIKTTTRTPDTITHQGGPGFSRDPKSELFLLAVANMVGEDTFYEAKGPRDERFRDLIHRVAVEDPDWLARFVPYLRDTMNMRSASIVLAAETVHARLTRPVPASSVRNRDIISSALMRADEPAEMIGYWHHRYGRSLPMPVKRGIADALGRLYTERSVVKWDGQNQPIRFADVLDLVHPRGDWQSALFRYLLDERHKRAEALPWAEESPYAALKTINAYRSTQIMDQADFRAMFSPELVSSAALTWETASSKYGKLDARFWEAMVPSLGIFALVRNLRNIEAAGVSKPTLEAIRKRLVDPEEIAKSRMFPLRFYGAWVATKSLTFGRELEEALDLSLRNIPALEGGSIVLVDISGSMQSGISDKSKLMRWQAAGLFGAALKMRNPGSHLYTFSVGLVDEVVIQPHGSALRAVEAIGSKLGGGTDINLAISQAYAKHPDAKRIIVLSDEQTGGSGFMRSKIGSLFGIASMGPQDPEAPKRVADIKVPIYTFNLAGYKTGFIPSGEDKRYTFGGLSDAAFSMLPQLEIGKDAGWPF